MANAPPMTTLVATAGAEGAHAFDLIIAVVRLLLASASPRRAELLAAAAVPFDVFPVDVDERPPGIGCVTVDITLCGICGTEVGSYRSGILHSPEVCGHEWVGIVSAVGPGISPGLEGEVGAATKKLAGTDAALHARDFFDCVKSRKPTAANAEVMRRSHVACHAAAIAWMLKRKLRFDPRTESFSAADGTPDEEANALKSRPERDCFAV